ncbi:MULTISPECIES: RHS repeat-associated core domain-containing protein [Kocuria]|uniref:RHS repeat-associated core domain-containing protein n=2 Tax=Kocuria TaxID=57493 RepID=UPI0021A2B240|nr:RHS repeat-associated core domain-containing protein [Kocuria rhizophila]MCT1545863.1 hypothetical protein [Kocuria rhizophila]
MAATLALASVGPAAAVMVPTAVPAASSGAQSTIGKLGARPGATRLPVSITDSVNASVDVGTGNVMLSIAGLPISGVGAVGLVNNSQSPNHSESSALPQGFELTAGSSGSLTTVSGGMLYTGGDGFSAKFTASGAAFTPPKGVKADLVKTSSGYTLTSRTTAQVSTFNADGQLTSVADRNGNKTTYTYTNGVLSKVTGSSGPAGARTATITTSASEVKVSQTSGTETRAVVFEKDAKNNLTAFTDAKGQRTTFESVNGQVRKVTSPEGHTTEFTYDDTNRLTALSRVAGDGQNAVTRLAYASDTQTLVAGPNTDQSQPVGSVPRSTFTLDASDHVTKASDPVGRSKDASYTADFDIASTTSGSGASAGTTTNTFGANGGQSLTKSTSPTGAASSLEYGNTASATKYLPTSGTDPSGNKSTYTYNGAGNMLSSAQAGGTPAAVTYNADGTVATATAPGNGTNSTKYTYDGNKQLTKITPVTGTTLGAQALTYDVWGRTASITDGRGNKISYAYDRMGRVTKESYSDGTPAVSYTYDADGHQTKRVDGSGTTTMGYDEMGRLTTRGHSAAGEEVTYGYDKASNLTSVSDKRGTTTYDFDAAGTPTTIWYESGGQKKRADMATDDRGRRTDIWMETPGGDHTKWAAHQHTDYDKSGRISHTVAKVGNGETTNTTVQDKTYCYTAGTTPAGGCTAGAAGSDRAKIQWVKDAVDSSATVFTYDTKGQVTKAVRTGGTDPRTYTYTYDARGNRLTSAKTEGYQATNLTFNAANEITNPAYAYDASGNMTKDIRGTFTYNAAGQMTTHTREQGTFTYTYAGGSQSELIKQKTTRGNYEYGYGRTNQFGLPVVEQVSLNGKTAHLENDPVTGQPLMLRTAEGVQSLYVYDGIGNPEALVTNQDSTTFAYDYDPYGVPALNDENGEGDPVNPFQFKGGIHDRSTNWVKFGYRWYSVGTGRFTQRDTLDAPLDPANANRYTFAGNDPINYSDPLGLASREEAVGQLLGAGVAGLFTLVGATGGPGGALAGAAIGGCLGDMVDESATAALEGTEDEVGVDDLALRCAVGAASGSLFG